MQKIRSDNDFGTVSDSHQSHRTIAGAANALRVGVRRQAHYKRDAGAFYKMLDASKDS